MNELRKRVFAIIGDANAGKSTMIGHLTYQFGRGENGLKRNGPALANVLLRSGGMLRFWSRRMALQEAGITPSAFTDVETKKISPILSKPNPVITPHYLNLLIALRFDPVPPNPAKSLPACPAGHEYLSHFASSTDFEIAAIVLMPRSASESEKDKESLRFYLGFGVPVLLVREHVEPETKPIGHQVGQIRNFFGWA